MRRSSGSAAWTCPPCRTRSRWRSSSCPPPPRSQKHSRTWPRTDMAKTTRVVMPQLGESVHEGTISKWLVKVGDKVVEFEPMLEVDTDKVNAEVPAPVTGILREILAKEGETVHAGAEIAVVEVGAKESNGSDAKAPATPEAPAPAPAAPAPKASPAAEQPPATKPAPAPTQEETP